MCSHKLEVAPQGQSKTEIGSWTVLDEFFEHMPDAVVLVDGHGRGVRANQQFVRMFGYSQEEIVDADLSSLIIPPESREEAHTYAVSKHGEGTAAKQSVCIRKGGERFQISLIEGPLVTGKPASRYMICRELVHAPEVKGAEEERLRERLEFESREKDRLRLLLDLNNRVAAHCGLCPALCLDACSARDSPPEGRWVLPYFDAHADFGTPGRISHRLCRQLDSPGTDPSCMPRKSF